MIFSELRQFVETRIGEDVWPRLVAEAHLPDRLYLVAQQFPDSEFQALVAAAAKMMNISASALLEELGEFVARDLLKMYAHSVRPEWRTLDLIEHTEQAIHQVVREGGSGAHPPEIATTRTSEHELVVAYGSPRKLCAFAKGIVRGIAIHYGERPHITETTCMLEGAQQCTLEIRVEATAAAPGKAA
jgi:predicted hydrocarbon binding protein